MKNFLSLVTLSLLINLSADPLPPESTPETVPPFVHTINYTQFNPKSRSTMVEFYGECLFLQPNGSSLYYAVEAFPLDESIALPILSPDWQVFEIFPNYSPAFNIGARILFSDMDTSISANWERLFSSQTASHTVAGVAGDMIGPNFDIGPNSHNYTEADTKAKFHFDAANLTFGQRFSVFNRFYPNINTGGSFARIKQIISSTYENNAAAVSRTIDTYSTFTGAGPQLGFDFDYRIIAGFFLNGSTSLALVIGELENGTTYNSIAPIITHVGNPEPNIQTTTVPNRTQLVPALEEKLGFSYAGMFNCCKIMFGFGYQAQIYLNAIQTFDMTGQVPNTYSDEAVPDSGLYAVGFVRTLSNFILTGPYLTLSLVF